eukprot:7596144-Alexandrium_andersonii.AAC.1
MESDGNSNHLAPAAFASSEWPLLSSVAEWSWQLLSTNFKEDRLEDESTSRDNMFRDNSYACALSPG